MCSLDDWAFLSLISTMCRPDQFVQEVPFSCVVMTLLSSEIDSLHNPIWDIPSTRHEAVGGNPNTG